MEGLGETKERLSSLAALADPVAWASIQTLLEDPMLAVAACCPVDGELPELWFTGARARLRPHLTRLFEARVGDDQTWLIPWLEGRWPRGRLYARLPLGAGHRDRVQLVMMAPMPPPRLLLSEGPLPLPAKSVAHFREFHGATGARHLAGGGFETAAAGVARLIASWKISVDDLPMVLAAWPVGRDNGWMSELAGLEPHAQVALEVSYDPQPGPTVRLTLPRQSQGRVIMDIGPDSVVRSTVVRLKAPESARG